MKTNKEIDKQIEALKLQKKEIQKVELLAEQVRVFGRHLKVGDKIVAHVTIKDKEVKIGTVKNPALLDDSGNRRYCVKINYNPAIILTEIFKTQLKKYRLAAKKDLLKSSYVYEFTYADFAGGYCWDRGPDSFKYVFNTKKQAETFQEKFIVKWKAENKGGTVGLPGFGARQLYRKDSTAKGSSWDGNLLIERIWK